MSEEKFLLSKESAKGLQNLLRNRRDSLPQKMRAKSIQTQQRQVALVRCGDRVGSSSPYWVGSVCNRNADGTVTDYENEAVYLVSGATTIILREGAIYLAIRAANSGDGIPVFVVGDRHNRNNGGSLGGGPADSSDPEPALTLACNVFRPFGSATLVGPADQPCGIVADYARGRLAEKDVDWTHYLVCDADDIRDGNSVATGGNSVTYGDGDEVQITVGTARYSFVVTWTGGEAEGGEKCYLLRHSVVYDGDPLGLDDWETWTWDFEVYRPYGSSDPAGTTGVGRLVNDWVRCRIVGDTPEWTHYLECNADTDIQDGCTRSLGSAILTYGDGDEVRIGDGVYVVVWVELVNAGTSECYKRVFLMRRTQDPHNNGEVGPGGFWGTPTVVDYGVV